MLEHDEHEKAMASPEAFRLELPQGHPGHRPFSALLIALGSVEVILAETKPDLLKVRAGESLAVDAVSLLLSRLNLLGASLEEALHGTRVLHAALHEVMHPE